MKDGGNYDSDVCVLCSFGSTQRLSHQPATPTIWWSIMFQQSCDMLWIWLLLFVTFLKAKAMDSEMKPVAACIMWLLGDPFALPSAGCLFCFFPSCCFLPSRCEAQVRDAFVEQISNSDSIALCVDTKETFSFTHRITFSTWKEIYFGPMTTELSVVFLHTKKLTRSTPAGMFVSPHRANRMGTALHRDKFFLLSHFCQSGEFDTTSKGGLPEG